MQWLQLTMIEEDDNTGANCCMPLAQEKQVGEYYLRWA